MKKGFTLAEVLITLGVLGVVIAMTLPALIKKHEKKVNATLAKQSYSILANAIQLSEAQNGEVKYWSGNLSNEGGVKNTELFLKKYILPYLVNPKFCGEGTDASSKICGFSTSYAAQTYILNNGVCASILSKGSRGKPEESEILYILIDVNGNKRPNRTGSDRFYFLLNPTKGLIPFGGGVNFTREDILNGVTANFIDNETYTIACKQTKSSDDEWHRHGCTLLLMMDGWEFKEDYPY